ncbi:unnamed protein product [Zymoseptoria tritici ST99CH_3D1]|nr:unnamed protein product [Zymoseptoria tritici ST99CH_3D1]
MRRGVGVHVGVAIPFALFLRSLPVPYNGIDAPIIQLVFSTSSGEITLRRQNDENTLYSDFISRLEIPSLVLETFVNTSLQISSSDESCEIPRSTTGNRCFTSLRPGETLHFPDQCVKIRILEKPASFSSTPPLSHYSATSSCTMADTSTQQSKPTQSDGSETEDDVADSPVVPKQQSQQPSKTIITSTPQNNEVSTPHDDDSGTFMAHYSSSKSKSAKQYKKKKDLFGHRLSSDSFVPADESAIGAVENNMSEERPKQDGQDSAARLTHNEDPATTAPVSESSPNIADSDVDDTSEHPPPADEVADVPPVASVLEVDENVSYEPINVVDQPLSDKDDVQTDASSSTTKAKSKSKGAQLRGGKRNFSGPASVDEDGNQENQPLAKKPRASSTSEFIDKELEEIAATSQDESDGDSQIPAQGPFPSRKSSRAMADLPQEESTEDEAPSAGRRHRTSRTSSAALVQDDDIADDAAAPVEAANGDATEADAAEDEVAEDEAADDDEVQTTAIRSTRNSSSSSSTKMSNSRGRISKAPIKKTPARRKSASPSKTPTSSARPPTRILLSGSRLTATNQNWLKRQTNVVDEVPGKRTNYACVVRDENIPTTIKVLRALIAGKRIITDQWVVDSKEEGSLLDVNEYLHPDLQTKDIGTEDRRKLFNKKILFFTHAAKASFGLDWEDVITTAMEAGASHVDFGTAFKGATTHSDKVNRIDFGIKNDTDANKLKEEYESTVYDKAMFAKAILRAKLELDDDEFVLE